MKIFKDLNRGRRTILMIAHDLGIAAYADRIVAEGRAACGWEYE